MSLRVGAHGWLRAGVAALMVFAATCSGAATSVIKAEAGVTRPVAALAGRSLFACGTATPMPTPMPSKFEPDPRLSYLRLFRGPIGG